MQQKDDILRIEKLKINCVGVMEDIMSIFRSIIGVLLGVFLAKQILKLKIRFLVWRERMKDKQFARRYWKRQAIVVPLKVLGLAAFILMICAVIINVNMKDLLERDVDECTMYHINRMDERIENWGVAGKLLIWNQDRYEALKQENDRFIDAAAAELIEAIDKLEPVDKFESYEHMREVGSNIGVLLIRSTTVSNDDEDYCAELERRVPNYSKVQEYKDAYDELVEQHRTKCEKCELGIKTIRCIVCSSKNTAKDVSGEEDEECYNCDGSGIVSLELCKACKQGYIYHFE